MEYWNKFNEAQFNLNALKKDFEDRSPTFEHFINNFLSSAQSVFWVLNKTFNSKNGYEDWSKQRPGRLSESSKIFKELRNISVKEGPIRHEGVTLGFDFGPQGVVIPSNASLTTPMLDTHTGRMLSNKAIIDTPDGSSREVEIKVINDFSVKVESDNKIFALDNFIKSAEDYLLDLKKEIETTEEKFNKIT